MFIGVSCVYSLYLSLSLSLYLCNDYLFISTAQLAIIKCIHFAWELRAIVSARVHTDACVYACELL